MHHAPQPPHPLPLPAQANSTLAKMFQTSEQLRRVSPAFDLIPTAAFDVFIPSATRTPNTVTSNSVCLPYTPAQLLPCPCPPLPSTRLPLTKNVSDLT